MKKTRRMLVLCLAMAVALGTLFSGCAPKIKDTEDFLEIQLLEVGVGRTFLDKIIEEYNKEHPEIEVHVSPSNAYGVFDTTITGGPDTTTYDLYIASTGNFKRVLDMEGDYILDLSSVIDEIPEGQSRSIRQRLNKQYKDNFTFDGEKMYTLPWQAAAHGLVYNKKWFDANGIELPLTSDHLLEICDTIVGKGKTPFIGNMYNYWAYVYEGWWAQYQGVSEYFNFWQAKDALGNQPSQLAWAQQGRLEALEVMQEILSFDEQGRYKYVVEGSNTTTHTEAQTKFLNEVAVMTPNASWLETEMRADWTGELDVRLMRLPVISSILEVLPKKSVTTDTQLREVVKYIDDRREGLDVQKPAYAHDEDIARIEEARNVVFTTQAMGVCIPSYAKAVEAAKDFVQFMYSDVGLKIMAEEFVFMPAVEFDNPANAPDITKWSTFAQSCADVHSTANYIFNPVTYPLFYRNGDALAFQSYPELTLGATNPDDRLSASEFYKRDQQIVASKWKNWMSAAGLEE